MMKLRVLLILAALSFGTLVAGCDDDSTGPSARTVIMPLGVGKVWYGTQRTYADADTIVVPFATWLYRDTVIGGERWFEVAQIVDTDTTYPGQLLTNRSNGLWETIPPNSPNLRARYPAEVGESYPGAFVESQYTVIAVDTPIVVPAGPFGTNAYRYGVGGVIDAPITVTYFAPDYGPVKSHTSGDFAVDSTIWELDSLR